MSALRLVLLVGLTVLAAVSPGVSQAGGKPYEARVYGVPAGCRAECPVLYFWTGEFGRGLSRALAECRSQGYRCTVEI